ncbi:MAG: sensor histidine kinase, partial [Clostridia bacterium]|nr:sensor histidine kinase [Clostridia bacterium]
IGGFMIYAAYSFGILKDSSKHIAKGYTDWYVDSDTLIGDFKSIGEDLNSISDGINTTLEQRLTTERTKTRFIANVSNGIKKPLASIINYTDLISKESDPVKIKEYSGVLVRNSERLKHLLGGLVELSNAVTGDLEVEAVSCDAGTLIDQVAAEFDERCSNAGLNLITSVPDIPLNITVDRNCILKVFDNLMSNVCKYSLPGSRVYLTLEKADDNVRFVIRNTSGKALNLSSDELMESLTRGDTACFDEEYGLDLCIANTLTKLQNGSMDIAIDGDLFKVTLEFPCL